MALITTLVVLSLIAVVVLGIDVPARLRAARVNGELAALVDGATAALVEEQLHLGPQLVRVHTGHRLHGAFLDVELDAVHFRLRLYHDGRRPMTDDRSFARLIGLTWLDGIGWVATFDGARGPERYFGWLVESVAG
jgi:hypothetical protein